MKLSENIRNIRKENNLSQEQLAEKLGVSRQAVSKWESGQSYPEMDKVLLICRLFNYNIDELMNNSVKEVNETKQSKINFNKYVDDFFGFITKTVNMLSSMSFSQKFKCFIEQILVIMFLVIVYGIIGTIGFSFVDGIFGGLSSNIFDVISTIFGTFYSILALIVGVAVFLHIFKVRYLDYYEFVEESNENEPERKQEQENVSNNNKIVLEKKQEKIVIRDPKDSSSKFLTGMVKIALLCVKFFVFWCALGFVFSFVGLIVAVVLSFLFVKTGLVFFGTLLGLLASIVINYVILELCYRFIVNKKVKKTRMAISLIISLVFVGLGIGFVMIGITEFDYLERSEINSEMEDEYNIPMTENLVIYELYNTEYIENDSDDIKIVVKHSKYYSTHISTENDSVHIYNYGDDFPMEMLRNIIQDLNNKEIVNYYSPTMYIYGSKDNIEKLRRNKQIRDQIEIEKELEINELYDELYDLRDLTNELYTQIDDLQVELNEQNYINQELEDRISESEDF